MRQRMELNREGQPKKKKKGRKKRLSLLLLAIFFAAVVATFDMDESLLGRAALVIGFDDESGELTTPNATGVEAFAVLFDLEACLSVMTVDDSTALVLGQELHVVVPVLF